ncbi:hypothetical protein GCM10022226_78620 [Sphaerisporangium flaviroseum]|uniref:ParB-like N-terminal domain-containing protein n=1 Tax=Sphaerisporangium flaviroseum TaxID=509199 RepID=A0ABP7JG76_9ACTN
MPRGSKAGASANAPKTLDPRIILAERPLIQSPTAKGNGRPLPVSAIAPNPENLRDDALDSAEKREEMVNSLTTIGLIHAVVVCDRVEYVKVRPEHTERFGPEIEYVLLAGERRWLAAKDAGWESIRGEIQNDLLKTMDEVFIHENLGRVDLNPFQEAEGYRRLQLAGHSLAEIGVRNNKSKAHISKRLRLLELGADARSLVLAGELSIDTAYNILAALGDTPELAAPAWLMMRDHGISAKEAAQRVLTAPEAPEAPGPVSPASPNEVPSSPPAFLAETPTRQETSSGLSHESPSPSRERPPQSARRHAPSAAVDGDRDRAIAAEARAKHCQTLLDAFEADHAPHSMPIAMATVVHAPGPALELAHQWLVALGDLEAEALGAKAYAQTMIKSGDRQRIGRLAYATALADAEIRAADRRRKWDMGIITHVRHLMDVAGYTPHSAWESDQLGLTPATS